MRWLLSIVLLLVVGCVQVPSDTSVPKPAPGPSVPDDQFADVDQSIVTSILADPEMRDAMRLRKYSAMYRGMADACMQEGASLLAVINAGLKTTEMMIRPQNATMKRLCAEHIPVPKSNDDRQKVSDAFRKLSKACHAAAHRLETGGV